MPENKKTNTPQWLADVSVYLNKSIPLPPILDLEKWIADLRD